MIRGREERERTKEQIIDFKQQQEVKTKEVRDCVTGAKEGRKARIRHSELRATRSIAWASKN